MYCHKPRRPYPPEKCYLLRVNGLPFPPEILRRTFCAGMGYLFLRRMENCSRLRGKWPPNPPGMLRDTLLRGNLPFFPRGLLRGNVLRWNGVSFSARNGRLWARARENAPNPARTAPRHPSEREWGIFFCAEWEIVAAYAGKRSPTRPERSVATFCAGMRYLFLRRMGNCCRLRRKMPTNPPGLLRVTLLRRNGYLFLRRMGNCCRCAGIGRQIRPESSVVPFCAGMWYLFTRRIFKLKIVGKKNR